MTVPVDRDRLRRTTAPHLLCERARTMPDSVAFRSKHFGIYRERRWRDDYLVRPVVAIEELAAVHHIACIRIMAKDDFGSILGKAPRSAVAVRAGGFVAQLKHEIERYRNFLGEVQTYEQN